MLLRNGFPATTCCFRVTVSTLPSNQCNPHHPWWNTQDFINALDFALWVSYWLTDVNCSSGKGALARSMHCRAKWEAGVCSRRSSSCACFSLAEDTPHTCLLCNVHRPRLPNAGLQWEVTIPDSHCQGVKANKYQVRSGWFPVGQDCSGARCCLLPVGRDGWPLASGMRMHHSRAVGTRARESVFCRVLPSPCKGWG